MENKSLVQISYFNELQRSYYVSNKVMCKILAYVQNNRYSFHYDYNCHTNDAFMYFDVDTAKQVYLADTYINSLISLEDE